MKSPHRSTIRVRLTLLYTAAFFFAGAMLIGLTYLFLAQSLDRKLDTRVRMTEWHVTAALDANAHNAGTGRQLHETLTAQFERDRDDTLHTMLTWSLTALAAVGVAAAGFGWLLAGRAMRPLQQITATARRVADHSLHERIALDGPHDEIKDLADTVDAMLERLDHSFDSQRRFVAYASHELRTPLTINRALIEVALDSPDTAESTRRLGTSLLEVNQRHERLIDGLLTLAGSEQPLTEHDPVDLANVARHALTASGNGIGIQLRASLSPALVLGDAVLLERLMHNLLDNAIRYNITGKGSVSIATGTDDGRACLTVENTGPVVPSHEVDALFEPFRRLAPAEETRGAGLGLSIVRAIAHAHGGRIKARARPAGGLAIQVLLPPLEPSEH